MSNDIPLIDILTASEARLERKLAICLAMHPKDVIANSSGFKPEVDQMVCKYWLAIMNRKDAITNVTDEKAFEISMSILIQKYLSVFWKWWDILADENSFNTINETLSNIKGLRVIRKTIDFIQVNKIINETLGV